MSSDDILRRPIRVGVAATVFAAFATLTGSSLAAEQQQNAVDDIAGSRIATVSTDCTHGGSSSIRVARADDPAIDLLVTSNVKNVARPGRWHGTLTWTAVKGEPRVRVVDLMDPDISAGNASWSMTAPRWAKSFSLRVTGQRGTDNRCSLGAYVLPRLSIAAAPCRMGRQAFWYPVRNETRGDALMVGVGGRDDLPYGRWHVTAIDRFEGGIQRASRDFRPTDQDKAFRLGGISLRPGHSVTLRISGPGESRCRARLRDDGRPTAG